jgi:hypothetical protein
VLGMGCRLPLLVWFCGGFSCIGAVAPCVPFLGVFGGLGCSCPPLSVCGLYGLGFFFLVLTE